jgi:hypothetical protein
MQDKRQRLQPTTEQHHHNTNPTASLAKLPISLVHSSLVCSPLGSQTHTTLLLLHLLQFSKMGSLTMVSFTEQNPTPLPIFSSFLFLNNQKKTPSPKKEEMCSIFCKVVHVEKKEEENNQHKTQMKRQILKFDSFFFP